MRPGNGIAALLRFVRTQPTESCEFCGVRILEDHCHLIEPASRRIHCTCPTCAEALAGRQDRTYRLVPREVKLLADFRMTDAEWHALGLPIDMAFIFHSTPEGRPIALYPGPMGATQSALGLESWSGLVARNPALAEFEPDVEALVLNRIRGRREYYRLPIDRCFALVGSIRKHWQGWSGGDDVWRAIDDFFGPIKAEAVKARM